MLFVKVEHMGELPYWGTYAPEVETALKGLDFTGKHIRIVSTHEGSGLANMPSDV